MSELIKEQPFDQELNSDASKENLAQSEIIESVGAGAMTYGQGTLVCGPDGLAQVVSFRLVEDKTNYGREDRSIRQPKVQTNPEFTLRYSDGTNIVISADDESVPQALYVQGKLLSVPEDDPFSELTFIEVRGHRYGLGELVSFGNQIGTLAIIYSDKQKVAISAREVFGQQTPSHLYLTNINQVDFIERDDGAIRRNPDGTVFKPSLLG